MYQELLLEHYKYPYHKGDLSCPASFATEMTNPSCGDAISMAGVVEQDVVTTLFFQGKGCVISQATASILVEHSENKTVTELLCLDVQNILDLIKIELGPVRLKCALLPLEVLQAGLHAYKKN